MSDELADPTTWSPILQEAVKAQELGIIQYDLTLDYDYWNYCASEHRNMGCIGTDGQ